MLCDAVPQEPRVVWGSAGRVGRETRRKDNARRAPGVHDKAVGTG